MGMEAGRKFDAWISRYVFDLEAHLDKVAPTNVFGMFRPSEKDPVDWFIGKTNMRVPHYSTDITAAWQVVEAMGRRGYMMTLEMLQSRYMVTFYIPMHKDSWPQVSLFQGHIPMRDADESVALMICLAAHAALPGFA